MSRLKKFTKILQEEAAAKETKEHEDSQSDEEIEVQSKNNKKSSKKAESLIDSDEEDVLKQRSKIGAANKKYDKMSAKSDKFKVKFEDNEDDVEEEEELKAPSKANKSKKVQVDEKPKTSSIKKSKAGEEKSSSNKQTKQKVEDSKKKSSSKKSSQNEALIKQQEEEELKKAEEEAKKNEQLSAHKQREELKANAKRIKKEKMSIDCQFIMDVTGSMGKWITQCKEKIQEIAAYVKKRFKSYSIRFSFVGYRDYFDAVPLETFDFDEDPSKFENFMQKVKPNGGDDFAEDVFSGFAQAAKCSWQSYIRLAFFIADAPAHGSDFHDLGSGSDKYLNKAGCDRAGLATLFDDLKAKNVKNLFCIHMEDKNTKMEQVMDELWTEEHLGYTFVVRPMSNDASGFFKFVVESISTTIEGAYTQENKDEEEEAGKQ